MSVIDCYDSKVEEKRLYDKERYQKHKAELHEKYLQNRTHILEKHREKRGDIPPVRNKANRPSKYNKKTPLPESNIKLIAMDRDTSANRGSRKRRNKDIPVAMQTIYGDNAVAYANLMNEFNRNK